MTRRPARAILFPYTTLFRSGRSSKRAPKRLSCRRLPAGCAGVNEVSVRISPETGDRKSTRLNSSHLGISYAVFCLKKKNNLRGKMPEARNHAGRPGHGEIVL